MKQTFLIGTLFGTVLGFWLHDLKRKGISDAADDRIAGHISDSTRANYNVKIHHYKAPS